MKKVEFHPIQQGGLLRHYTEAKEGRLYVLWQWEKYLAKDVEVAVRCPKYIREAEGILENRLSFHNDAFLSTDDDMGTYNDIYSRQEELAWTEKELLMRKNGGEMPSWGENSGPQNAETYIKNHLGYRLYVDQIQNRKNIFKPPLLNWLNTFRIQVVNSGYAPLDSQYKIYVVTETDQGRKIKETMLE